MAETTDRRSADAPAIGVPTTAQTATIVDPDPGPAPRRRVGTTDLEMFPVALGGSSFGWTASMTEAEALLDAYRDHGGNVIDTADSYAGGRSEIIIGNWMRRRRNRDRMIVATKVGKSADHPGVRAPAITASVRDSLRRLRTDRIDLLSLHVDDPEVEFEETLLAVDELIRAGDVRQFGAAHHTGDRLIEARVACAQLGVAPMATLQNHYSLVFRREYETGLARIAQAQDLGVMPRFPLAGGFLAGRYRSRAELDPRQRRGSLGRAVTRAGLQALAAVDRVAAELDAASATVALAWLLSKPAIVAPIVSATTPDEVVDLAAAPGLRLSRRQLTELDRASQPFA
jgi:aryl-alcohol dehydrogenase-like predicted oxidoreductase